MKKRSSGATSRIQLDLWCPKLVFTLFSLGRDKMAWSTVKVSAGGHEISCDEGVSGEHPHKGKIIIIRYNKGQYTVHLNSIAENYGP